MQVLSAIFTYACRADTLDLGANPVDGTDKRREDPPAALDYYEVEEVEALARACEHGEHRVHASGVDPAELAARRSEDQRDGDAFRLLFYTGLRLGEVLTLRWAEVDLVDRSVARTARFVRRTGDPSQGPSASFRALVKAGASRGRAPIKPRRVHRTR